MNYIGWACLAAAVLMVLWVLGTDHSQSMERCQAVASFDTCAYSLR